MDWEEIEILEKKAEMAKKKVKLLRDHLDEPFLNSLKQPFSSSPKESLQNKLEVKQEGTEVMQVEEEPTWGQKETADLQEQLKAVLDQQSQGSKAVWKTQSFEVRRMYPWVQGPYKGLSGLNKEILDLQRWLRPTDLELSEREAVIQRVQQVVCSLWPRAYVKAWGSSASGLYLPSSLLHLVILGEVNVCQAQALFSTLVQKEITHTVELSGPFFSFVDNMTNIQVEVIFQHHESISESRLVKEFLEEFPAIPPLVLVLKLLVKRHGLGNVCSGGMGTHHLTLLMVYFLQVYNRDPLKHQYQKQQNQNEDFNSQHHYNNPQDTNVQQNYKDHQHERSLSRLLLVFLRFYVRSFNFQERAISVNEGGQSFPRSSLANSHPESPLYILNPLNQEQNTGDACKRLDEVLKVFHKCEMQLEEAVRSHNPRDTLLGRLLGDLGGMYKGRSGRRPQSRRPQANRYHTNNIRPTDNNTAVNRSHQNRLPAQNHTTVNRQQWKDSRPAKNAPWKYRRPAQSNQWKYKQPAQNNQWKYKQPAKNNQWKYRRPNHNNTSANTQQ